MIRVVGGEDGTSELEAARELAAKISTEWADLGKSFRATLVAGMQCYGQRTRDIDVVLILEADDVIELDPPSRPVDDRGRPFAPRRLLVRSLCLAIEVKDHDAKSVRFDGNQASVLYRGKLHNASIQNHNQQVSLRNYLNAQGVTAPFVVNLLWFRGIRQNQLPPRPHNLLGANASWELFVNAAAELGGFRTGADWRVDAFAGSASFGEVARVLATRIEPSGLDRTRMEHIGASLLPRDMTRELGQRLLLLRGRGGTGKTMALLQLAWTAYRERGERCLLLTYNRVLAADLSRLLALLRIPDDVARESIQVRTIVGYLIKLLGDLGFRVDYDNFNTSYSRSKAAALEYLDQEVLLPDDLERLRQKHANAYAFDLVFIDEGQDWPDDEIRLLETLFPRTVMTVADGVDQFVRSGRPEWRRGLTRHEYKAIYLDQSLRMKRGLTHFANRVAARLGLGDWQLQSTGELSGGRIYLVPGDFFASDRLGSLLEDSRSQGNAPIDALICVPPSDTYDGADGERLSHTGDRLERDGYEVWNAVSPTERTSFPRSTGVLRVLQYESCRGAEGWLVLALQFDRFCDDKARTWCHHEEGSLADPEAERRLFLARWIMIAISRALDTLVIELTDTEHWIGKLLLDVAAELPDLVEVQPMH